MTPFIVAGEHAAWRDRVLDGIGRLREQSTMQGRALSRLNVGSQDRALRILAGLALIGLAVTGTSGVWGYLGIVPLLTGLTARCPVYSALGIATTAR